MGNLVLILQVIALVCFFIGWMAWQVPGPPRRAFNWTTGGFFWLLLSLMIGGFGIALHTVGR